MPITGALEGWDQQALFNQQQQGNEQNLKMNALTIAGTEAAQNAQQQQQTALQDAAKYANSGDTNNISPNALQQAGTPSGPQATSPNMGQVDYNEKMATRLAQLGQPVLANAAWAQASQARQDALKQASLSNSVLAGNLKNVVQQADVIGQHMQGVTDQASYDQAVHQMAQEGMDPKEVQILASKPYDPRYVQGLVSHAISAKDAATQKLAMIKVQSEQDYHQATLAQRQALETQKEAAQAALAAAKERNAKVGGNVASPTTNDFAVAEGAVKQALPGIDKDTAAALMPDVAARAKALVMQNKGMDMSTASYRAIQELKDSGQLQSVTTNSKTFLSPFKGEDTTREEYTPKGNSPKEPLPDPGTPHGRVIGKFYNVNGQVRQWLGTGAGQ